MTRKVALVTGASRGIGAGIAVKMASLGYDLILTCISNVEKLNNLGDELAKKYDINCRCIQVDHSDSASVNALFEQIDRLDVLINNAGISQVGLLQDMTDEMWHKQLGVNLDGVFYTCRRAIPLFLKQHDGHIINISSVWGEVGASYEVAYSTSKGGVNAFTKALAKELAPSGISVNAVACGMIDTDMNAHLSQEDVEDIIADIPIGRIGTPADIADVVGHIAECNTYMTGQIITVDGGWI